MLSLENFLASLEILRLSLLLLLPVLDKSWSAARCLASLFVLLECNNDWRSPAAPVKAVFIILSLPPFLLENVYVTEHFISVCSMMPVHENCLVFSD